MEKYSRRNIFQFFSPELQSLLVLSGRKWLDIRKKKQNLKISKQNTASMKFSKILKTSRFLIGFSDLKDLRQKQSILNLFLFCCMRLSYISLSFIVFVKKQSKNPVKHCSWCKGTSLTILTFHFVYFYA